MEECRPANAERFPGGSANRSAPWWATLAAAGLLMLNLGPSGCACDLEIATDSLPAAVVNVAYSYNLDSHCGGDTWFLSSGDLPPGMALQSNGDVEGVPTFPGLFTFTVGLIDFDSGDEAFRTFALLVTRPTPAG